MATRPVPPSTPGSKVTVHYPFHPLRGRALEVVCAPRPGNGDGAVTVLEPTGQRLKIPCWMLSPAAAQVRLAERAGSVVSARDDPVPGRRHPSEPGVAGGAWSRSHRQLWDRRRWPCLGAVAPAALGPEALALPGGRPYRVRKAGGPDRRERRARAILVRYSVPTGPSVTLGPSWSAIRSQPGRASRSGEFGPPALPGAAIGAAAPAPASSGPTGA